MNLTREEYLNSPAARPPPGITPNFKNPENDRGYAFPLFLVVVVLANGIFLARLWVQLRIVKKMLLEDWILTVAWLVYAGAFCAIAGMICNLPVGMHQWDMNMEKFMRHMFLYNCAWIVYGVLMALIKVNILLQYIRIFVPDGRPCFTLVASKALIALNTVYYTMFVFMLIFTCVPRHKFWDSTAKGRCLDWRIVLVVGNIVTFISDVIIWVVPQNVIWRLQLDKSRKRGLSALFTIGIFAIVCAAVRIHYQAELLKSSADITYVGAKICFWGTCQLTAGFLVACLPTMPLLYQNVMKQTWAGRMGSTVRTILRRSRDDSGMGSGGKADLSTIGGGGRGKRFQKGSGKRPATDVEFDELVNKTDWSITSRVTTEERYAAGSSKASENNV